MSRKPNILFVNTDQHTWDAISAYGNTWLKTPHIDRLVENGVSFMRSYSTDPVCCPARASWATGRYSSEVGMPFNGGCMPDDIPDIGQILNANDYNAFHAGKWHVTGRNVRESFQCLFFGAEAIDACGGEMYDPVTTRSVLDLLSRYDDDKPFYIEVGLVNPHDICEYEHNHEVKIIPGPCEQGFLTDADLPPLPANFNYDERETAVQKVFRRGEDPLILRSIMKAAEEWTEQQWRFLLWHLHRFIEKVDVEIGLILNALDASSSRDNTLIIFSIDHGEAAGQHQMIQKFTLYEESVRVPFIVSSLSDNFGLDKDRRDTTHLVSGVDLLPTVLDYAGIACPDGVQGQSLKPLLEGQEADWRTHVYMENNFWARAMANQKYKYITEIKPGKDETILPPITDERRGLEQLFDLDNDPWETKNLAGESQYADVIKVFRQEMASIEGRLIRRAPASDGPRKGLTYREERLHEYWDRLEQ